MRTYIAKMMAAGLSSFGLNYIANDRCFSNANLNKSVKEVATLVISALEGVLKSNKVIEAFYQVKVLVNDNNNPKAVNCDTRMVVDVKELSDDKNPPVNCLFVDNCGCEPFIWLCGIYE